MNWLETILLVAALAYFVYWCDKKRFKAEGKWIESDRASGSRIYPIQDFESKGHQKMDQQQTELTPQASACGYKGFYKSATGPREDIEQLIREKVERLEREDRSHRISGENQRQREIMKFLPLKTLLEDMLMGVGQDGDCIESTISDTDAFIKAGGYEWKIFSDKMSGFIIEGTFYFDNPFDRPYQRESKTLCATAEECVKYIMPKIADVIARRKIGIKRLRSKQELESKSEQ